MSMLGVGFRRQTCLPVLLWLSRRSPQQPISAESTPIATKLMQNSRRREFGSDASPKASSETGDSLLLTPGPLTTSLAVKQAMLRDYGSRDKTFVAITAKVRKQIVNVLQGSNDNLTTVLLQGSGTFAVEAMISQFVPRGTGKLLILCNGAYGRRMATICEVSGRAFELVESPEDQPLSMTAVNSALDDHVDATHVAVVSCETTTGVLNPISGIASAVASRKMGLLLDAMSSFGVVELDASMQFDAIAASSNKGLQGSPGLGFVVANKGALADSAGNASSLSLDLYNQWCGFEKSGEWRFTPPTHCVLALAQALDEFEAEGGVSGRRSRYETNAKILIDGMRNLGFKTVVADESQAPVIVTFDMPTDPKFGFQEFYDRLSSKGYVIYPGKLTKAPSFRVGCIGHIFPDDMKGFLRAVSVVLGDMGVSL